jgi:hypothetical protein
MSDEGALSYQKTAVDIINLLEVAAGAFRERFASRGLSIGVSLPESATVFGDRDRLMQLLITCWKTACAIPIAAAACRLAPARAAIGWFSILPIAPPASPMNSWSGWLSVFIVLKGRAIVPAAALV